MVLPESSLVYVCGRAFLFSCSEFLETMEGLECSNAGLRFAH